MGKVKDRIEEAGDRKASTHKITSTLDFSKEAPKKRGSSMTYEV